MKNFKRGFTLIELLVVIAIIGILSSIVLASLSSARTKGEDSAITASLSNMRAQAEIYYTANNAYGGAIAAQGTGAGTLSADCKSAGSLFMQTGTGGLKTMIDGVSTKSAAVVCSSGAATVAAPGPSVWAVTAQLKSSTNYFCVDSTGAATTTLTNTLSATDAVCG